MQLKLQRAEDLNIIKEKEIAQYKLQLEKQRKTFADNGFGSKRLQEYMILEQRKMGAVVHQMGHAIYKDLPYSNNN